MALRLPEPATDESAAMERARASLAALTPEERRLLSRCLVEVTIAELDRLAAEAMAKREEAKNRAEKSAGASASPGA